jgi:hypothetical protein
MDEIIFSYTRADAIADGVLIDVSKLASEAGFRIPVALTSAAWAEAVAVHSEDTSQDETGRLWDVLNVLRCEARRAGRESLLIFEVHVSKGGQPPRPVGLKAHYGPGDDGEPVLTVMMPDED